MDRPPGNDYELELRDYPGVVWRRRVLILVVVLVAVTVVVALSFVQAPVYSATAELELPAATADLASATESTTSSTDLATAMVRLQSDAVAGRVRRVLGSAPPMTASVIPDTSIIRVTVESSDRRQAATAADTYAREYLADRKARALDGVNDALVRMQPRLAEAEARWNVLLDEFELDDLKRGAHRQPGARAEAS